MKHLGTAIVVGLFAAALGGPSCTVEAYCFRGCNEQQPLEDGGGGSSSGTAGVGGTLGGSSGAAGTAGTLPVDAGCPGVDLATDVDNCGACGNRCALPNAFPVCVAGRCEVAQCAPGYYDLQDDPLDPTTAGCEYRCPVDEPTTELCNGLDDDCDGAVDQDDVDLQPPPGFCNTTPGTPCASTTVRCDGASGEWICEYPPEVETDQGFLRTLETRCDGVDGNCDGQVDEAFPTLGVPCDDGGLGVCRRSGFIACDPADPGAVLCDLPAVAPTPTAEQCNGLDDDCNGVVDDGVVYDMVSVPVGSGAVLVDRYEASRHDATAASAGVASAIACVREGVLPWTSASFSQALSACQARGAGYRLCTAAELRAACQGGTSSTYPYGASYQSNACNGVDHDGAPGGADDDVLLPTGSLAQCVTPQGLFDLSGNATEWTSTRTGSTPAPDSIDIYQLHGGSYVAPEEGLSCNPALAPRAAANTILPTVGFRCCRSP